MSPASIGSTRRSIGCCLLALMALHASVDAAWAEMRTRRMGDDIFAGGEDIELRRTIAGDALVAGGHLVLDSSIDGDAVVVGGRLELGGKVNDDLYAAGGRVQIGATVNESARIVGGEVQLLRGARITEGLSAGGGRIAIDGEVGSYAQLVGGDIRIDGHVGGDVHAVGGALLIGPNAVIDGAVTYRGPQAAVIAPGARVHGPVHNIVVDGTRWKSVLLTAAGLMALTWVLGWALVGALLLGLFPNATQRVTGLARSRAGLAMLLGLVALLVVPPVMALLGASLVGIPLALLALLLYLLLLPLGYVAGVATAGDWLLERRGGGTGRPRTGARIGTFLLMLPVVAILSLIPVVGWLAGLLLWMIGMGAILLATVRPGPAAHTQRA